MVRMDTARQKQETLIGVLSRVAPGTELREAIDRILQAGSGALIVIGGITGLRHIMSGGFNIDTEFSAPRLFELAKMDGAVVLSQDLKTIYSANVHLVPESSIVTHEAGMRHRTAERVARGHKDAFVIAISEKMNTVSIYVDEDHFTLENIPLVLAKADQALQTLSRYKSRLDKEYSHLNMLEVEDMVTLRDVIKVMERNEMVVRIAEEVRFQVSELGKDGRLVSLQLNELMVGVEKLQRHLSKDYYVPRDGRGPESVVSDLGNLSPDELTDDATVARVLGFKSSAELMNKLVRPRGYRVLSMIPGIPSSVVDKVVARFDNLKNVMRASPALLDEVAGVGERRALAIKEGLDRISETIMMEGYL
ncbi:MAG: DNA integrity scanning diadenylate cyclase DisA [Candidatus Geothermincolia bacterium]